MLRYTLVRLAHAMVVILVVSLITFGIIHAAPGGPSVLLAPDVDKETAARLQHQYGLDQPLPVQYLKWLGNVARGDLGTSFAYKQPVMKLFVSRLPATLALSGTALLLTILLAIPLGVISAVKRYSFIDYAVTVVSLTGISVPIFWLGILMIILFAVQWRIFPAGGMYTVGIPFSLLDRVQYLFMPAAVLACTNMASIARYTRSAMLNVLSEDYVRTARAKGLAQRHVVVTHALRNAMLPVVTVVGLLLPRLVGGTAITETVFAWPGVGRLAVDAASTRDYPLVMAITLCVSVAVVLSSLLVDLVYVVLDPRIRYS
jgi:peptide/nickel transport system permease protein